MIVQTRHFGEINLEDEKIITLENGILGFEDCKRFTILYDNEDGDRPVISWFQSLDEPALSLPVVYPSFVKPDYSPIVEDEILNSLGELQEGNLVILLTLTVPPDLTKMTTNLKAPIIINEDTKKGCQVVVENDGYVVKYNVYEIFKKAKEAKGESYASPV